MSAGPAPLGLGHATIEESVDVGSTADAHRPEIRRALAFSLSPPSPARRRFARGELGAGATRSLSTSPRAALAATSQKLFDFGATQAGAEYSSMDLLAPLASGCTLSNKKAVRSATAIGERSTCGSFGDCLGAAFDWDKLLEGESLSSLGSPRTRSAPIFGRGPSSGPHPREAKAFVLAYEEARGRLFIPAKRIGCGAAFAFSCAYTARCGHALGQD